MKIGNDTVGLSTMTAHAIPVPVSTYRDQRQLVESIRALRRAVKALERGDVYDVLQSLTDAAVARGLSNTWGTPSHTRVIYASVKLRERVARAWAGPVGRG